MIDLTEQKGQIIGYLETCCGATGCEQLHIVRQSWHRGGTCLRRDGWVHTTDWGWLCPECAEKVASYKARDLATLAAVPERWQKE